MNISKRKGTAMMRNMLQNRNSDVRLLSSMSNFLTFVMMVLSCGTDSEAYAFVQGAVALHHVPSREFLAFSPQQRRHRMTRKCKDQFRMDIEGFENSPLILPTGREKISHRETPQEFSSSNHPSHHQIVESNHQKIDNAQTAFGMPWRTPIHLEQQEQSSGGSKDGDGSNTNEEFLLYMPFWEWQMEFLKDNLTNLRILPCTCHQDVEDFTYKENTSKQARIFNLHLASDEYRKIRMTYYDAGEKAQVFNSLWYPSAEYNLPVLGIDLIQFNRKKHLVVVDFQPIHEEEHHHTTKYEHILESIQQSYPSLQGKMSARFYDETRFFSKQMIFSRFEETTASSADDSIVSRELMPAFQQYVEAHLQMLQRTPKTPVMAPKVLERQQAYDTYSAERDPAAAMLEAVFGKDWADKYMYEFLFSMSEPH